MKIKFHSLSETQLTHSYVHIKPRHLKLRSRKTNSITGNCKNWVIIATIQYVSACPCCLNIIRKWSKHLQEICFNIGKLVRQTVQFILIYIHSYIYTHTHIYIWREREICRNSIFLMYTYRIFIRNIYYTSP